MRSNIIIKAVKYFSLIIYTVIFCELFLMLFHPMPMLPRFIEAKSFGIRGNIGNERYIHKTPEYRVEIRTNSRGIRSDYEITYEKPEGIKRIILLSDSFGMGYGVNLEDTFLYKLEQLLEEDGENIEIVNLSVSGYGTAEELIMLEEEGVKYSPDLVLVAWHRTDLADNVRSGLYRLNGNKVQRAGKTYLPAVKTREMLFSIPLYRWIAGNSHFYNWIREFAASTIKNIIVSLRGGGGGSSSAKSDKAVTKEYSLSLALLDKIREVSRDYGAEFLILDIPERDSRTEFHSTFPETDAAKGYDFHIVNPMRYFKRFEGEKIYWERSHGHFTPLGTTLVAESLYDYIRSQKLLR